MPVYRHEWQSCLGCNDSSYIYTAEAEPYDKCDHGSTSAVGIHMLRSKLRAGLASKSVTSGSWEQLLSMRLRPMHCRTVIVGNLG